MNNCTPRHTKSNQSKDPKLFNKYYDETKETRIS